MLFPDYETGIKATISDKQKGSSWLESFCIIKGLLIESSSPDKALLEGALDVVLGGADGLQLAQVVVEVLLLAAAARMRVVHLLNQFDAIDISIQPSRDAKIIVS